MENKINQSHSSWLSACEDCLHQILTHGWANKARDMEPMASGLIGEIRRLQTEGGRRKTRDVIVATLVSVAVARPTAPR